jgi:hypothetical protein
MDDVRVSTRDALHTSIPRFISLPSPHLNSKVHQPEHSVVLSNAGGTHLASVRHTLFGWNNETLNAWTMIIGLVITSSLWLLSRCHLLDALACCKCV